MRTSRPSWTAVGHDSVLLGDTWVPRRARVSSIGEDGAPDLFAEFEILNGVPECTAIRWQAKPGGRGVRSSDLRMMTSIDRLTLKAFLVHGTRGEGDWPIDDDRERWAAERDIVGAAQTRPKAGPNLEQVAEIYREHIRGNPTAAVRSALGLPQRTAARRVQQARAAGLLPPTTRGRKGA